MNSWAVTENPLKPNLRVAELATCFDPVLDVDENNQPDLGKVGFCMKNIEPEKLTSALTEYQVKYMENLITGNLIGKTYSARLNLNLL